MLLAMYRTAFCMPRKCPCGAMVDASKHTVSPVRKGKVNMPDTSSSMTLFVTRLPALIFIVSKKSAGLSRLDGERLEGLTFIS